MSAATRNQLLAYQHDVWAFRLTGVALYQSALITAALTLTSFVPFIGRPRRSPGLILLCSLAMLLLQLVPSTLLSLVQVISWLTGASFATVVELDSRLCKSRAASVVPVLAPKLVVQ